MVKALEKGVTIARVELSRSPAAGPVTGAVDTCRETALVHSEAADRFDYGREHPLRMERFR